MEYVWWYVCGFLGFCLGWFMCVWSTQQKVAGWREDMARLIVENEELRMRCNQLEDDLYAIQSDLPIPE